ncbi:MAG: hypothetical protein VST70_06200 [Nitrospirota bacterium]|nr:hypothetical protein [Nitrospirota bacterium]
MWNKALDLLRRRLDDAIPRLSWGDLAKFHPVVVQQGIRVSTIRPANQQTLKTLDRAVWESLDRTNTNRDQEGLTVLSKFGSVKVRVSRLIAWSLKNASVIQKEGQWTVSLQTETSESVASIGPEIGRDPRAVSLARLSDGTRIPPAPDLVLDMKRAEKKLVREPRILSRKYRKGRKSHNGSKRVGWREPTNGSRTCVWIVSRRSRRSRLNPSRGGCRGPEDPEHVAERPGHPGEPRTEPLHPVGDGGDAPFPSFRFRGERNERERRMSM